MDKLLKFSLIIPVYNVEKYLKQCIESCVFQDMRNDEYEIIVVNDGSTDNSLNILNDLTKKYKNIFVQSQVNGGLSSARNAGLKIARGEYIWFIDSDDWIEEKVLNGLYEECIKSDLDCLSLYYQRVTEDGRDFYPIYTDKRATNKVVDGTLFLNNYLSDSFLVPTFIFKRIVWLENAFEFKKGIVFEDLELIPMVIAKMQRVKSWPNVVYNYRQRIASLVHAVNYKMIDDLYSIIQEYMERLCLEQNKGISNSLQRIIAGATIGYCILLSKMTKSEERQKRLCVLKVKVPKIRPSKELAFLKKICAYIYNISPILLFKILETRMLLYRFLFCK